MKTSDDRTLTDLPRHVAIIMDGNGRWASARNLPRALGHTKGAEAVRRAVESAIHYGVDYLTLFAFSFENWERPDKEISYLMNLLRRYLSEHTEPLMKQGVRIKVIGNRNHLTDEITKRIHEIEENTKHNEKLLLNIAISYGGRQEIVSAVQAIAKDIEQGHLRADDISQAFFASQLDTKGIPDPDLLIRTGGEKRVSNFLLWQIAYSELVFLDCYWPEFDQAHFREALIEYTKRERRYGTLLAHSNVAE